MVLNPAEPGGRRYDPLGQAEAKISELEQLLQKERDATEEQRRYHNKYRKRVRAARARPGGAAQGARRSSVRRLRPLVAALGALE